MSCMWCSLFKHWPIDSYKWLDMNKPMVLVTVIHNGLSDLSMIETKTHDSDKSHEILNLFFDCSLSLPVILKKLSFTVLFVWMYMRGPRGPGCQWPGGLTKLILFLDYNIVYMYVYIGGFFSEMLHMHRSFLLVYDFTVAPGNIM